ncbi:MAG: hypothetical protein ABIR79_21980 [Candidatus Binatia bacterium]
MVTRAFTLLVDIKIAGQKHLLSETFQSLPDASEPPSGDDGFVDEHALVDRFRLTLPPAGQPLLYFVPRGALRERLTQLLGSDATAQPVFVALKEPSFDDHRGDLLATAVSLNVGLALAVPGKVCGVASPTPAATSSNGGHTFTPTPVVTATLHPTASVTATASPSSTATALRSATPTPVITGTPARTATAAATAAGTVTATVTATPTRVDTATPTVQTTTTVTATSSPVPSLPASTRTAGPIATPTATSLVSSGATPTPPIGIPEIVLEDRTVALRSRGNDTYVRVVVTNPTTVELGRMPYTATFTIDPADGQVSVTTREIQGRPVISAGYKDYLRVGITTAADAQPGEYRLTGVFRFSPTSLPAGSPPIQITRTARVRIE